MELTKEYLEQRAAFRRAMREFLRHSEEGAKEAGITATQHMLMLAVMENKGRAWATISELAESLGVRHHAAVGLVNRCAAAGLVERQRDTTDRRVVRVFLTPRGHELLEALSLRNRGEVQRLRELLLHAEPD